MSTIVKLALAGAIQCLAAGAVAQTTGFNHLDCWFDEATSQMRCPGSPPLQTGRDARVDQTFDMIEGTPQPLATGRDAAASPPDEPKQPAARVSRPSRVAKAPSCKRYRTYNPTTRTYRGYDGVIHACP